MSTIVGTNIEVTNIKYDSDTTAMIVSSAGQITAQGENTNTTNLQQGLAKVWIKIDGTQSAGSMPQDSFNVTSMTDTNTGRHIINYTNNMNSTAYSPVSNHHYTGLEANDQYSRFSAPSYLRTTAYRIAGQYVNSSTGYEDGYFTTGMNGDLA